MHREIEWAAAVVMSAVGLSQIYAPQLWIAAHHRIAARGVDGIRAYGLVVLSGGVLLATFHNVWSGAAVVLTVTAWLLILEGALCVLAPAIGAAGFSAADPEIRRRAVVATGVFGVIVAGVLWAELLVGPGVSAG